MNLSNRITYYIKNSNNGGMKMFWADICLFMYFYEFTLFLIYH